MKRSIRVRFTCLFFSVIALVVMTALCMNNFGLERFYKQQKVKDLQNAYTAINRVVMEKGSDSERLTEILNHYSSQLNITIAVMDSANSSVICTSERGTDSLFRHIFNNKQRLASLYAALTGRRVKPQEITITTLRGVFFNDIKNDISFRIGDRDIILMEHQSSWNPNMPLRMFWYVGKLYQRQLDSQEIIYRSRLVKIPAPEFYVFL